MSTEAIAQAPSRVPAAGRRSPATVRAERRRFWIGVACAALVHASVIVGITRSSPRTLMGEHEGQPEGISVMLVDAADLKSKSTVPLDMQPPGPTGSIAPPPRQPSAAEAEPQPPQPPEPKPKEAAVRAIEREKPEAVALPEPAPKETATQPPKPKPKTQARAQPDSPLQLSMPSTALPPGGLGASFSRPPGITRSGENDDFARGVIRALRQTMPAPSGVLGRVTVKLLLNENGNLVEVVVLRGADDPRFTQSIVFAVRQASFPFPPTNSNLADRTFMVTYIYH